MLNLKKREKVEWIINAEISDIYIRSFREDWTQKKFEKILNFKSVQALEKIANKKINVGYEIKWEILSVKQIPKREKMKEYTKENLQTDVDWLIGQGVDESEAEPFIMNLLKSKFVE